MKKKVVICIIMIALFTTCAGNKAIKRSAPPEWLDNPESKYPNNAYISAIGSGSSRSDAEKDAAAKLSRIFRTNVSATETMEKRYEELTRGNETSAEDYARSVKNVTLSSEESLVNIQFGESYTDSKAQVHTIAYLDRFETGNIYEEMISGNSKQVRFYLNKSTGLSNPMDKYAYAGAAWMIAQKNQDLLRQYKIISPQISSLYNPEYDLNAIQNNYVETAREITFYFDFLGDADRRIENIVSRIFTAEGFQIVNNSGYIMVSGSLNMSLTDLNREDDTIFYRWDMSLNLTQPDGKTILSLNPSGRSGSISEQEAKSRVYIDIEKKLDKTLKKELNSWFDNIVITGK